MLRTPPGLSSDPEIRETQVVRLLEEHLSVHPQKHKVGEVIIRKTVETEMVAVPVRREKLIVEQISPEHRQLAEIDLSKGEIQGLELHEPGPDAAATVQGEFYSLSAARSLLDAIALNPQHHCGKVKLEIEVSDPVQRQQYRQWFERVRGQRS